MSIVRKIPWTRQPPPGVQIDKGNPLSRGLVGVFNAGTEVTQNQAGNYGSNKTLGAGPTGRGALYDTTNVNRRHSFLSTDIPDGALSNADGLSVVVVANVASVSGTNQSLLGIMNNTDTTARGWYIYSDYNSDNIGFTVFGVAATDSGISTPIGSDFTTVFTWDGSNTTYRVQEGGTITTASGSVSTGTGGIDGYHIGCFQKNTTEGPFAPMEAGGVIYATLIYNRVLSSSEKQSISENPWQIFQPRTQVLPTFVPAAQTYGVVPRKIPWTRKPDGPILPQIQDQFKTDLLRIINPTPAGMTQEQAAGWPAETFSWTGTEKYTTLKDGSTAADFDDTNHVTVTTTPNYVAAGDDWTAMWIGEPNHDSSDREGLWESGTFAPGVYQSGSTADAWGYYWGGWKNGGSSDEWKERLSVVTLRTEGSSGDVELWAPPGKRVLIQPADASSWSAANLRFGACSGGSHASKAKMGLWLLWLRRLSNDEMRRINDDPWGTLFKPQTQYLPTAFDTPTPQTYGVVPRKVPWTRQPPAGTPLDKGNKFVRGLHSVFVPIDGTFREIIRNLDTDQYNGTPTRTIFPQGQGSLGKLKQTGIVGVDFGVRTSGDWMTFKYPGGLGFEQDKDMAIAVLYAGTDLQDTVPGGIISIADISATDSFLGLRVDTSNVPQSQMRAGSTRTITGTTAIRDNGSEKQYALISANYYGTARGSVWQELFIDGVSEGTDTFNTKGNEHLYDEVGIGTYNGDGTPDTNGGMAGSLAFALIYHDRALSESEWAEFAANPWQIFEPQTQYLPTAFDTPTETFGVIKREIPWTREPPSGTKINWGHPLAQGLKFLGPHGDYYADAVSGQHGRQIDTADSTTGYYNSKYNGKRTHVSNNTSQGGMWWPSSSHCWNISENGKMTMLLHCAVDSMASFAVALGIADRESTWVFPYSALALQQNDTNGACWVQLGDDGDTSGILTDTGFWNKDGSWHWYGARWDGTTIEALKDGSQFDSGSMSYSAWDIKTADQSRMVLFDRQSTTTATQGVDGEGAIGAVWSRVLSDEEVQSFQNNPWQIFEPRTQYIPVSFGAAAPPPGDDIIIQIPVWWR